MHFPSPYLNLNLYLYLYLFLEGGGGYLPTSEVGAYWLLLLCASIRCVVGIRGLLVETHAHLLSTRLHRI